jgi:tripartite-type tricarboxylate transporter receptor subunit TctC
MWSRALSIIVSLIALTAANSAWAQTFPAPGRSISIVVGFPAGGGHDVMGRALAQDLSKELGAAVIVENRPGAAGVVSVQAVARAEPDGHTLLFNSLDYSAVRQAVAKVPYDLERDLTPISLVGISPIVLVVHNSVPARTLTEFKEFVKTRPGGILYGTPGAGTLFHLAGEALQHKLGVSMTPVAYRGGAPFANDLAGGHVLVGMSGLPPLVPLIQAGTVRLIATSSMARSNLTPDVPSFAEGGIEGVDIASYVGLAAPKNTPAPVLQRLEQATRAAAKAPDLREAFQRNFFSVIGSTGAEYKAFIDDERARQVKLIRAINFKFAE